MVNLFSDGIHFNSADNVGKQLNDMPANTIANKMFWYLGYQEKLCTLLVEENYFQSAIRAWDKTHKALFGMG